MAGGIKHPMFHEVTQIATADPTEQTWLGWRDLQPVAKLKGYAGGKATHQRTTPGHVRSICTKEILKAVQKQLSALDRKSTRLNSSHSQISYAVFCLKKKK